MRGLLLANLLLGLCLVGGCAGEEPAVEAGALAGPWDFAPLPDGKGLIVINSSTAGEASEGSATEYALAGGTSLTVRTSTSLGRLATGIAVSPAGTAVAIGFGGASSRVELFSRDPSKGTLTLRTSVPLPENGIVGNLEFHETTDATLLRATWAPRSRTSRVFVWSVGSDGSLDPLLQLPRDVTGANDSPGYSAAEFINSGDSTLLVAFPIGGELAEGFPTPAELLRGVPPAGSPAPVSALVVDVGNLIAKGISRSHVFVPLVFDSVGYSGDSGENDWTAGRVGFGHTFLASHRPATPACAAKYPDALLLADTNHSAIWMMSGWSRLLAPENRAAFSASETAGRLVSRVVTGQLLRPLSGAFANEKLPLDAQVLGLSSVDSPDNGCMPVWLRFENRSGAHGNAHTWVEWGIPTADKPSTNLVELSRGTSALRSVGTGSLVAASYSLNTLTVLKSGSRSTLSTGLVLSGQ